MPRTRRYGSRHGQPVGRERAQTRDPHVSGKEGGDARRTLPRRAQDQGTEHECGHGPEDSRHEASRIEADPLDGKRSTGDGGLQGKIGRDPSYAGAAVDRRGEQGEPAPAFGRRPVQPEGERSPAEGADDSDAKRKVDG